MKHLSLTALLFVLCINAFAQNFINGNFEVNTASDCSYNNINSAFNAQISNVYAFGSNPNDITWFGECDLQTNGCYVTPQNGNWCVGLANNTVSTSGADAIAIELSSPLVPGHEYTITFYIYGNTDFYDSLTNVSLGESLNDSTAGVIFGTAAPTAGVWTMKNIEFTATQPSKYITVNNVPNHMGWNQVDNFAISFKAGLNDEQALAPKIKMYPNPALAALTITSDKPCTYTMFDMVGNQVQSGSISGMANVDVSGLAHGMYWVRVAANGKQTVLKFVKE